MTKILIVDGESDSYTAMTIENGIGIDVIAKEVEEAGGVIEYDDEEREIYGTVKIVETDIDFNDPLYKFLIDQVDYDEYKHRYFYIIE